VCVYIYIYTHIYIYIHTHTHTHTNTQISSNLKCAVERPATLHIPQVPSMITAEGYVNFLSQSMEMLRTNAPSTSFIYRSLEPPPDLIWNKTALVTTISRTLILVITFRDALLHNHAYPHGAVDVRRRIQSPPQQFYG
jgi:hypothetical protein